MHKQLDSNGKIIFNGLCTEFHSFGKDTDKINLKLLEMQDLKFYENAN